MNRFIETHFSKMNGISDTIESQRDFTKQRQKKNFATTLSRNSMFATFCASCFQASTVAKVIMVVLVNQHHRNQFSSQLGCTSCGWTFSCYPVQKEEIQLIISTLHIIASIEVPASTCFEHLSPIIILAYNMQLIFSNL